MIYDIFLSIYIIENICIPQGEGGINRNKTSLRRRKPEMTKGYGSQ
jgi:hypothetical protein